MKPALLSATLAATLAASAGAEAAPLPHPQSAARIPNIVFILADDLGYGDLGAFGQNARRAAGLPAHATPNLDRMAAQGVRLTHHYCAAPVSAPSRASLLSGLHQGHASVRDNQFDRALAGHHTLATVLRAAGYRTAAIGKWGLQGRGAASDWPAHPLNRGFDYYYGYIRHVDGHEHYPKTPLYFKGEKAENGPPRVWENRADVTGALDNCYTADLFAARAKSWMIDHNKTAPARPFFIYLAFDTPHAVLELPPAPFPAGAGARGGLQWLGTPGRMINTATGKPDSWTHPDYARATFTLDGKKRPWPDVNKRYATAVRRIDDAVGDLLATLDDLGLGQNTLVVFTSDNGPSIESYLPEAITPEFFASYGPFDGIKRDLWEGGLRVPAIARWPARLPAGAELAAPCATWVWLATVADAARLAPPAGTDGVSLLPVLASPEKTRPDEGAPPAATLAARPLYFEYYVNGRTPDFASFAPNHRHRRRRRMQASRQGDLMAVRYDIKNPGDDFEIYNVVRDPKETRDLAAAAGNAGLQTHFKNLALQSRRPAASNHRPYDATPVPPASSSAATAAFTWTLHKGDFPWTPDCATLRPDAAGAAATLTDALAAFPPGQPAALRVTTLLHAPADGEYTFTLDLGPGTGALLRLHGATLIDATFATVGAGTAGAHTASIRLQAGPHPLTLTCHHTGAAAPSLSLKWTPPGQPRERADARVDYL
jgi:arylsulfatase A-like enzyme